MPHRALVLLLIPGLAAAAASAPPPADQDRPVPIAVRPERAQALYLLQGDATPERPVGDAIVLRDVRIPARVGDKGKLELDLARDGTFKPAKGVVAVSLPKPDGKGTLKLELLLTKAEDGAWRYRTLTQLTAQIGTERLVVVDGDGDGVFNEAGVDAIAWPGCVYAFPLPGSDERWCTPTLALAGLAFGPGGEDARVSGRPIATSEQAALPVLLDINQQRAALGLTPRPESAELSPPLQRHCQYMVGTGVLAHPEQEGVPGYSAEGHAAGMASILGMGTPAEALARQMINTFYHRQDVVRPDTLAFGVGYAGRFGGIDGRRALGGPQRYPVQVPVPDQVEVPTRFSPEAPDPIGGDRDAGFPVTVYFDGGAPTLTAWTLEAEATTGSTAGKRTPVECYVFDAAQGGAVDFNRMQHVVGLIAKQPLAEATRYHVSLTVGGDRQWTRAWSFATIGAKRPQR